MGRLRNIGRLRAGGSQAFSPSSITFTTGLWLDQSDITTGFQDSAGTSPQTATGQPTGKRLDKSGNSLHVLQATSASRPIYTVAGSIQSDVLDGVDDGYATAGFAAATLGTNLDCFITLKRNSASPMVVCSNGSPNFFGVIANADPGNAAQNAGAAWTMWVNGVQVGGTATTTRGQLDTALGNGTYKVFEVRNLDLSAWAGFSVGLYTSFMLGADVAQIVLCPAQSTAVRNQLRTFCGAKGGLTL